MISGRFYASWFAPEYDTVVGICPKTGRRQGAECAPVRDRLAEQKIEAVIPRKGNENAQHDPKVWFSKVYRGRCVAEHGVGWIKELRRIGTRFEKLAVNFHGMLQLAVIDRYLNSRFSDRA